MKHFICLFALIFTLQISAQNNEVLANGYLLTSKKMLSEGSYDEAEKYLKKAEAIQKDQKTTSFLQIATQLYAQKKEYKKAKSYADLYFKQEKDKASDAYKEMLMLYVNIHEKLTSSTDSKSEDIQSKEEVPFAIIEEVPVFPGCKGTNRERKTCLDKSMRIHIGRNFNADIVNCIEKKEVFNEEKGVYEEKCISLSPGKKRIYVFFKIDRYGDVVDVTVRAPHPKLSEEAIRIVKKLPKMKPGMQRGKPVGVKYTLPIVFNVE